MNTDKKITIELTNAEALVLFEWLARTDAAGSIPLEHEAEEFVFWSIEGQLESVLAEPFEAGYSDLVAAARMRVLERSGLHSDKAPTP